MPTDPAALPEENAPYRSPQGQPESELSEPQNQPQKLENTHEKDSGSFLPYRPLGPLCRLRKLRKE